MTYTWFDQNGQQTEISTSQYFHNVLNEAHNEMRNHYTIQKKSEYYTHKTNLHNLIKDFEEFQKSDESFFKRNSNMIEKRIFYMKKAMRCKRRHNILKNYEYWSYWMNKKH